MEMLVGTGTLVDDILNDALGNENSGRIGSKIETYV